MNSFYALQNRLSLKRSNRESCAQIIGEHAEQMCELVRCKSKRELLTIGVRIDHLTEEWIYLVTRSVRPDSKYAMTASKLIHAFSDIMCDYILDKIDMQKIVTVVNLEAQFFGGGPSILGPWVEYTASIINVAGATSHTDDHFYQLCTECIRRGQVLGNFKTFK
jgi:hypothetical protein